MSLSGLCGHFTKPAAWLTVTHTVSSKLADAQTDSTSAGQRLVWICKKYENRNKDAYCCQWNVSLSLVQLAPLLVSLIRCPGIMRQQFTHKLSPSPRRTLAQREVRSPGTLALDFLVSKLIDYLPEVENISLRLTGASLGHLNGNPGQLLGRSGINIIVLPEVTEGGEGREAKRGHQGSLAHLASTPGSYG